MASKRSSASKRPTQQQRNAREQMRIKQQQAAARRRRINIIIGASVAVAVVIIVIILWQVLPRNTPEPPEGTPSNPAIFIPPNGTAEMGWIEIKSPDAKPGALVVDEHTDYQCPWCEVADKFYGASMQELAARGDIILRIHVRTMVGDRMLKNDDSVRAAQAATCADTIGKFPAYHEVVFANQPTHEGDGYTDDQLRIDFAAKAGITGDDLTKFQACYDSGETKAYVLGMERVNWTSTTINGGTNDPVQGTPMFFVNGKPMEWGTMVARQPDQTIVPTVDTTPDGLLAHLKSVAG